MKKKEIIKNEWESIIKEEIDIVILNMQILDTRKYNQLGNAGQLVSEIVLIILNWIVDEERKRIKETRRKGIEIAKKEESIKEEKRNII